MVRTAFCEFFIDDMEIFRPVADMFQLFLAVRNPAKPDQRNPEMLRSPQNCKAFHVHHVCINCVIGSARHDIRTRGKPRRGNTRDRKRSGTAFGRSRNGVRPFSKPSAEASMSR